MWEFPNYAVTQTFWAIAAQPASARELICDIYRLRYSICAKAKHPFRHITLKLTPACGVSPALSYFSDT